MKQGTLPPAAAGTTYILFQPLVSSHVSAIASFVRYFRETTQEERAAWSRSERPQTLSGKIFVSRSFDSYNLRLLKKLRGRGGRMTSYRLHEEERSFPNFR